MFFLLFFFTENQFKYIQIYMVVNKKIVSQIVALILLYKGFTLIITDEKNT